MKEVTKQEFYSSKYMTDPKHDVAISIDDSKGWPYTTLLKLKTNHKIVGKITPENKYYLIS